MDDDELDILAWTMLGEAGGEGTQGMADVGHVVLNRLNTGRYGSSLTDVALAPKQFSTWNSGAGGNDPKGKYPKDSREFKRAREIASQVVSGTIPGPPGRPLDYHTPSVSPYWADSKSRNGSYTRNGHVMYPSVPVPPGELPEVASLQDTRRTPALPPVPTTPSPDMAMMRRAAAPSQLIRDSFAQLPRPGGNNAGDSLAMRPVQGGRQQAPMFDAAYDERVGAMRQTRQPIDSQGMATGSSRAPAPVPAMPSPQLAGLRATDPALQAALNNRYPQTAVGGPPTTRAVQSVPMVAPRMQVSASDMARGRNGWETIASIPSTPAPTAFSASDMARGRSGVPPVIDRLGPSTPGLPALYGGFSPEQVAMIGVPAMPEIPGAPRTRMASAAPFPMPRPSFMPAVGTSLSVRPMPPMPIPRPMMQPQQRRAPVPMPLAMRPAQQRAPLRIVVQRDQPQQQQPKPTPQGFTDNGNGSITSNEYGSTYYSRHL